MHRTNRSRLRSSMVALAAVAALSGAGTARAGIPVLDVSNLAQSIAQVQQYILQLEEMFRHYQMLTNQFNKLKSGLEAISGARNLGDILNNPLLVDYIPPSARQIVSGLQQGGYAGLSTAAKGLRDAAMVYNCAEVKDNTQRASCQADLARPYQYKAFYDDALSRAGQRAQQIQSLMAKASSTKDSKEIAEVSARIGAENALLSHELSQITLMRAMSEADERVAASRAREAQRAAASRTGTLTLPSAP
jgi:type IV secretion system protein VirB5